MQFKGSSRAAALLAMAILTGCGVGQDSSSPQADAISVAQANAAVSKQARDTALARAKQKAGAGLKVSMHKSTDMARFLRVPAGSSASLGNGPARTAAQQASESAAFFRDFGPAVGVSNPASMRLQSTKTDRLGHTHLTYRQYHGDVPVFGAPLKPHFVKYGRMHEVAGTAIPDISVSTPPTRSRDQAGAVARAAVVADRGDSELLRVGGATLYIFREGLAQGVPNGENHLAWEVEVTDGGGVRERVYVDAHSGKVIDRINMVQDAMFRRAYNGLNLPRVPDNYPNGPYWVEGSLPDELAGGEQHDHRLEGDLRLLLHQLRGRLHRRPGRFHGRHLQPRLLLPQRVVERDVHLLLSRSHDRRRHDARVGPRLHAVHARPHLPVAAGSAERGLLGHLG
jgi:hypothetical protein